MVCGLKGGIGLGRTVWFKEEDMIWEGKYNFLKEGMARKDRIVWLRLRRVWFGKTVLFV